MAFADQDDPFLQVQSDVQQTLDQTRPLFSSYLRIRTLATSPKSPELQQSRSELLSTLSTLSADLSDLVAAVNAVENDPYRFGLDVAEVARRREFVRDVGGELESMRRELEDAVERTSTSTSHAAGSGAAGGNLPDPNNFRVSGGECDYGGVGGDDPSGEFEHQQQMEMMHEQDMQLDGVFRTVGNLRTQAEEIGRELEEQGVMLDEVDTLTDRVGGKLQSGVKKVGYIIKKNEDTASSCCIVVLILVLVLLLILVIVL